VEKTNQIILVWEINNSWFWLVDWLMVPTLHRKRAW
jgi:hypothetical protein